jgi:outer membrane lipoprotein carrier protein
MQEARHTTAALPRHTPNRRGGGIARLFFLLLGAALAQGASAKAEAPIDRLHDFLKGLNTLSSQFQQVTLSPDGQHMVKSEGMLYIKRPGKFRWVYEKPVPQVIIADGSRVWLHDLELDQISNESEDKALQGTPAELLAGNAPIESEFKIMPWNGGNGLQWVELQPKAKDTQIVKIRIGFLGDKLDTLLMQDTFGQLTRFTFNDTKRNPVLKDDLFELRMPPGGNFFNIH